MKIYLIGEFLTGRLEVFYKDAFESLGLKVKFFNTAEPNKLARLCWANIINAILLKELDAFKPDLILVFKGFYLWPKTIIKIKKRSRSLVFCLNSDSPFNLSSPGSSSRSILDSIPYYDCYFTFSRSLVDEIKKVGAKKVGYLPFGYDPKTHQRAGISSAKKAPRSNQLVFVGSWDKEREHYFKGLSEFDFGIWGSNYWASRCRDKSLRSKWRGEEIYAQQAAAVLGSAKIALNVLRLQNKNSHNMRTFEAPACAAFVLSEHSPEIEEFFKKDKEIVFFSTPLELKEKARYYLNRKDERIKIAEAGYQRCISSGYSYLDRARNIIDIFNKFTF